MAECKSRNHGAHMIRLYIRERGAGNKGSERGRGRGRGRRRGSGQEGEGEGKGEGERLHAIMDASLFTIH